MLTITGMAPNLLTQGKKQTKQASGDIKVALMENP